ncbi:putative reverse transcriptase domain-containing protein [Tanacetum coccineum]|uniref:Reverse transcriptase domain-containing protein n=1 Tax=Tanacetum coccineum TaxID=301880 RepID=A0ABQ4ZQ65_9ASTR
MPTATRTGMTQDAINELIAKRVAEALEAYDAARNRGTKKEMKNEQQDDNVEADVNNGNGNRNGNGNPNVNNGGVVPVARECTYQDFVKCQPLNFKGTEGVVGLTRWFKKIETVFHISNCPPRYQVKYASCTLLDDALTWWNSHKRTVGVDAAYAMTWKALMKLMTERFQELTLLCTKMVPKEEDQVEKYIRGLPDNIQGNVIAAEPTRLQDAIWNKTNIEAKSKAYGGNKTGNNEAKARAYAIGGGGASLTALLDVIPSTLDVSYAVELADGRISETNVILRGCTLGLLGHPFDIDLMHVELGSFDVIVGMDWLEKYHAVIVYDEKIVCIPYGDEVLIIEGDGCNGGSKSKLSIISCTKTQKYIQKGCQVYLAQVTAKKTDDKSEEKRLEDVPIVQDFPKVFDLPGLPPTRQVEFQIDLVLGAAPVARSSYRLAPSEMQ